MPQMSPMWWTILMMMFITSFLMCMYMMYFNAMNYFKSNKKLLKKNMTWKW
nr:ATP synthase F0 subunit 8 [Aguriahana digitata]